MTGVLNEEAFGLGNRESQYENEVWAQSRGTENDGRYCPGFLPSWSLVKVARCSHQKYIYIWKRERIITGKAEEATLFYRRIWHLFHGSTLSHHRAEYLLCGSQHLMSKLIKHWKTLISQRVTHWHRTKTRHVMKGRRAPLVEHSLKCLFTDYQILNRGEKYKLKFLSRYLLNIHHGFR